jgi:hypothetical protein
MATRFTKRRWKQWSEVEARAALDEWQESGASALKFAQSKGFSAKRLHYWQKRLGSADELAFVQVVAPTRGDARIEIEHRGVVLRVREALDVEHLARIVAALSRGGPSC